MQVVCIVCRDAIQYNSRLRATECGHVFHELCIHEWIDSSPTCPACHSGVTKDRLSCINLTGRSTAGVSAAQLQTQLDDALLLVRNATRDAAIQATYLLELDEQLAEAEYQLDESTNEMMSIQEELQCAMEENIEVAALRLENHVLRARLQRLSARVEGRGGERLVFNTAMGPSRYMTFTENTMPAYAMNFEDALPPGLNRVELNIAVTIANDAEFLPTDDA